MKVAYFVNQYPAVSHTFIRREILALERAGVEVVRIALRGWDARVPDPVDVEERSRTRYLIARGPVPALVALVLHSLRAPLSVLRALRLSLRAAARGSRSVPRHLFTLAEAAKLARWSRWAGIRHIHAHFGTNSAEVVMLCRVLGGPTYSFTVHGSDEWDRPLQLLLAEKVMHASFVATISSFTRAQLFRWCRPEDYEKVHVIHCGLDNDDLDSPPPPLPRDPVIVSVGRLCAAKAQHVLVRALVRVRERGLPARLVLVGDGELRPLIEAEIRRASLGDAVTITGAVSSADVRRYITEARLLAMPSFAEGLPVALMEALSLGRPVIATYVGGIPELVRDGVEGWLVPASDVDALAAAIQRAFALDEGAYQRIAEAGRQRVSERHRADTETARLRALFASVLAEPPGP